MDNENTILKENNFKPIVKKCKYSCKHGYANLEYKNIKRNLIKDMDVLKLELQKPIGINSALQGDCCWSTNQDKKMLWSMAKYQCEDQLD